MNKKVNVEKKRKIIRLNQYPRISIYMRSAREALGLTREELADQCGVSHETVRYWESVDIPDGSQRGKFALQILDEALGEERKEVVLRYVNVVKPE